MRFQQDIIIFPIQVFHFSIQPNFFTFLLLLLKAWQPIAAWRRSWSCCSSPWLSGRVRDTGEAILSVCSVTAVAPIPPLLCGLHLAVCTSKTFIRNIQLAFCPVVWRALGQSAPWPGGHWGRMARCIFRTKVFDVMRPGGPSLTQGVELVGTSNKFEKFFGCSKQRVTEIGFYILYWGANRKFLKAAMMVCEGGF